jgi:hypothetical protein
MLRAGTCRISKRWRFFLWGLQGQALLFKLICYSAIIEMNKKEQE